MSDYVEVHILPIADMVKAPAISDDDSADISEMMAGLRMATITGTAYVPPAIPKAEPEGEALTKRLIEPTKVTRKTLSDGSVAVTYFDAKGEVYKFQIEHAPEGE